MLIDPERFERCFLDWVRSVFRPDAGAPRQIAIAGKTVRRWFDRRNGRSPSPGQRVCSRVRDRCWRGAPRRPSGASFRSCRPACSGLDLRGCLVSLDALACRPAGRIIGLADDGSTFVPRARSKACSHRPSSHGANQGRTAPGNRRADGAQAGDGDRGHRMPHSPARNSCHRPVTAACFSASTRSAWLRPTAKGEGTNSRLRNRSASSPA